MNGISIASEKFIESWITYGLGCANRVNSREDSVSTNGSTLYLHMEPSSPNLPAPKAISQSLPTLSCLYAFFFLHLTELNVAINVICEQEESLLSCSKEENPAHLDNKPITDRKRLPVSVLIGLFLFAFQWYFVLEIVAQYSYNPASSWSPLCSVCCCYITFSYLTSASIFHHHLS